MGTLSAKFHSLSGSPALLSDGVTLRRAGGQTRAVLARLAQQLETPAAVAYAGLRHWLTALSARHRGQDGPLVSVIMPVRDRPASMMEAIASVLRQSWRRFELLVIDDGSAQDVATLVRSRFCDDRIRLFRQGPIGVSAARNHGLSHAAGEIIAYLDSDNLWHPGYLTGMLRAFRARPALDSAYGILLTASHGDRRVLWDSYDRPRLEAGNFVDINVFMHRRRLFERCGGFDETLNRLVDWDLVLRYTVSQPPLRLAVLGATYRVVDSQRISDVVPFARSAARIQRKLALSRRKTPRASESIQTAVRPSRNEIRIPLQAGACR